ncbi:MAG: MFS transporter [Emcibacteraceae bacterium]|nr:MFS transporter [Emcibacteraceae bacterium]
MSKSEIQKKSTRDAILVYFQPKVIAILFLGFASGIPYGITTGTLVYWVSKIELSTGEIGLLVSAGLPYALKFLWAPLVDQGKLPFLYKIFGQRRSWLILTQCLMMPAIYYLGQTSPLEDYQQTYIAALLISIVGATQDIVIDGLRIESLEDDEQAAGSANYIYGYRIAAILFTVGSMYLFSYFGIDWPILFLCGSSLVLVGLITTLIMKEPMPRETQEKLLLEEEVNVFLTKHPDLWVSVAKTLSSIYMVVIAPFREFMTRRGWYVFLLFALLYKLGDSMAVALQTNFFLSMGFDDLVIANAGKLVGFWALLIGLAVGGVLMARLGLWYALLICAFLQMISNLMFSALFMVGVNTYFLAFTMGFENFATGMGATVFVAYLSLLCNRSFTITQFALLGAITQVTVKLLSSPSGYIVEDVGWFWFFIITTVVAIPGLLLLFWIKRIEDLDKAHSELANKKV